MSESKHTPGPWVIHDHWPLVIVPQGHKCRSIGGSVDEKDDRERFALQIAGAAFNEYSTFAHEIPKEQAKANARLIAAAPDLLNVAELGYKLSSWIACINWRGGENQKEWLDDLRRKIEEFQPLAKAAIAKAKGE